MRRREVMFGLSAMASAIFAGCGGGGGDPLYAPLPAWSKGTNSINHQPDATMLTVSFDLSKGYLLGLYTTKLVNGQEEADPMREIRPDQVDKVVYASPTVGSVVQSRAFALWDASGTVTIHGVPKSDPGGRLYVVLKPVGGAPAEAIPLQFDPEPQKSKFAFTGDVVVNSDNSLSYGNHRLGKVGFLSGTKTLRVEIGSDIPSAGFNGYASIDKVLYAQIGSHDTGWLDQGLHRFRAKLQHDDKGHVFFDFPNMPLSLRFTISLRLNNGTDLWLYARSPRWESLGELRRVVVNENGDEHLEYGDYKPGRIWVPTPGELRIDFNVDLLLGLYVKVGGSYALADVRPEHVSHFYWYSATLGWDKAAATGVVTVDGAGYYSVTITGVPVTGDQGWIKVVLTDGSELSFNPRATRLDGSAPENILIK